MKTTKIKSLNLVPVILIIAFLTGCAKTGGDKFIGTWQGSDARAGTLTIEKSGELYMIKDDKTNAPMILCPSGAAYKNAKLECSTGYSLGYDDKHDTLLIGYGLTAGTLYRVK